MTNKLKNCHDCDASPGEPHESGCDVERCSACGGQWIQCGCDDHDRYFSRWTGIWPGDAESQWLGIDLNEFQRYRKEFFIKPTGKNKND